MYGLTTEVDYINVRSYYCGRL